MHWSVQTPIELWASSQIAYRLAWIRRTHACLLLLVLLTGYSALALRLGLFHASCFNRDRCLKRRVAPCWLSSGSWLLFVADPRLLSAFNKCDNVCRSVSYNVLPPMPSEDFVCVCVFFFFVFW